MKINFSDKLFTKKYHDLITLTYENAVAEMKPTYKNLEVKNGTEALVTYSLYDDMTPDELERAKKNLRVYCKQDTWAMVVILDALRNLVKNDK